MVRTKAPKDTTKPSKKRLIVEPGEDVLSRAQKISKEREEEDVAEALEREEERASIEDKFSDVDEQLGDATQGESSSQRDTSSKVIRPVDFNTIERKEYIKVVQESSTKPPRLQLVSELAYDANSDLGRRRVFYLEGFTNGILVSEYPRRDLKQGMSVYLDAINPTDYRTMVAMEKDLQNKSIKLVNHKYFTNQNAIVKFRITSIVHGDVAMGEGRIKFNFTSDDLRHTVYLDGEKVPADYMLVLKGETAKRYKAKVAFMLRDPYRMKDNDPTRGFRDGYNQGLGYEVVRIDFNSYELPDTTDNAQANEIDADDIVYE